MVVDMGNPLAFPEGLGAMAETSTLVPEGPGGHFEIGLAIISPVTSPAERRSSLLHRDLVVS